jgi:hypothetical protein
LQCWLNFANLCTLFLLHIKPLHLLICFHRCKTLVCKIWECNMQQPINTITQSNTNLTIILFYCCNWWVSTLFFYNLLVKANKLQNWSFECPSFHPKHKKLICLSENIQQAQGFRFFAKDYIYL